VGAGFFLAYPVVDDPAFSRLQVEIHYADFADQTVVCIIVIQCGLDYPGFYVHNDNFHCKQ